MAVAMESALDDGRYDEAARLRDEYLDLHRRRQYQQQQREQHFGRQQPQQQHGGGGDSILPRGY
jgi:hypothetical protein